VLVRRAAPRTPVALDVGLGPPGVRHFTRVSTTAPVASALKNHHCHVESFLEVLTANGFFLIFWIQVAVSLLKRPLHGRFGSETATSLQRLCATAIPQRKQVPIRVQLLCDGRGCWSKATALFWCLNVCLRLVLP
jgi:hypothetical protein